MLFVRARGAAVTTLFALLLAFQAKHFLADYPLQGRYMLGKFTPGWGFVGPLTAHAAVHASFTGMIAAFAGASLTLTLSLAGGDFAAHFIVDRIKAGPRWLGRFKDMKAPAFWWCLGADQMAHHLTHYAIIYALMTVPR